MNQIFGHSFFDFFHKRTSSVLVFVLSVLKFVFELFPQQAFLDRLDLLVGVEVVAVQPQQRRPGSRQETLKASKKMESN